MRLALSAALLFLTGVSHAVSVTFQYSGAVNFVLATGAEYASFGTPFQGSITYEATSPDLQTPDASIGRYDAITAAEFSIGAQSITFVDFSAATATPYAPIRLANNDSVDGFSANHDATLAGVADKFFSVAIDLQRNANQLVSDQLSDFNPVSFFNGLRPRSCVYDCTVLTFDVFDSGTGNQTGRVIGMVDSLQVTSVPLPAAAWLLLSGAGGLLALGRRRR